MKNLFDVLWTTNSSSGRSALRKSGGDVLERQSVVDELSCVDQPGREGETMLVPTEKGENERVGCARLSDSVRLV